MKHYISFSKIAALLTLLLMPFSFSAAATYYPNNYQPTAYTAPQPTTYYNNNSYRPTTYTNPNYVAPTTAYTNPNYVAPTNTYTNPNYVQNTPQNTNPNYNPNYYANTNSIPSRVWPPPQPNYQQCYTIYCNGYPQTVCVGPYDYVTYNLCNYTNNYLNNYNNYNYYNYNYCNLNYPCYYYMNNYNNYNYCNYNYCYLYRYYPPTSLPK